MYESSIMALEDYRWLVVVWQYTEAQPQCGQKIHSTVVLSQYVIFSPSESLLRNHKNTEFRKKFGVFLTF